MIQKSSPEDLKETEEKIETKEDDTKTEDIVADSTEVQSTEIEAAKNAHECLEEPLTTVGNENELSETEAKKEFQIQTQMSTTSSIITAIYVEEKSHEMFDKSISEEIMTNNEPVTIANDENNELTECVVKDDSELFAEEQKTEDCNEMKADIIELCNEENVIESEELIIEEHVKDVKTSIEFEEDVINNETIGETVLDQNENVETIVINENADSSVQEKEDQME